MQLRLAARRLRCLLLASFAVAIIGSHAPSAIAQVHPNTSLFEYLWIKGRFMPPHNRFPEGRERGQWSCKTENNVQVQCSFHRGDLSGYDFIFRPKK